MRFAGANQCSTSHNFLYCSGATSEARQPVWVPEAPVPFVLALPAVAFLIESQCVAPLHLSNNDDRPCCRPAPYPPSDLFPPAQ